MPLQLAIDFNKTPGMFGAVGQFFADRDLLTTRHVLHKPGMLIKQMMSLFYFPVRQGVRRAAVSDPRTVRRRGGPDGQREGRGKLLGRGMRRAPHLRHPFRLRLAVAFAAAGGPGQRGQQRIPERGRAGAVEDSPGLRTR
jgi:hypothetical protein